MTRCTQCFSMRFMTVAKVLVSLSILWAPLSAAAQSGGLSGPTSVVSELEGDGLTDPQYRSDFPQNVATGWFSWKDRLAEKGFRFNIDYLASAMTSSSDLGAGEASSGLVRFYGNWQASENGALTFKVEHRHAYQSVVPQSLGLDGGAHAITGAGFNDNGTQLTNLFWTQRAADSSWTLQVGQIDATDFLDPYGLISNWTAFQNLSFLTNPTINTPNPGLGIAGGLKLGSNIYAVASVTDANADPTNPSFDVFNHGNLFKSFEVGYTSEFGRIYLDNVHATLWHADAANDGSRAEDYGATLSAAWFVDNKWMPFLRAGASKGTAALLDRSVSAGVGFFGRNTDLAGVGLNWGQARGLPGSQKTMEAFYRFSLATGLQITPSIQYIHNPLHNPGQSSMTVFGLRARIVF